MEGTGQGGVCDMEDMRSVIEEAVKSAEELYQEGYQGLYEKLYQ